MKIAWWLKLRPPKKNAAKLRHGRPKISGDKIKFLQAASGCIYWIGEARTKNGPYFEEKMKKKEMDPILKRK